MERYDNITPDLNCNNYSRVNKNTSLYEDVKRSELSRVNNNTNVRIIEQNGKTIDLEKIRKYINEVNNEPRSKRSVLSIPKEEKTIESKPTPEKVYDINSVLEKARSGREVEYSSERYKKVRSDEYDILSKIKMYEDVKEDIDETPELNTEEKTIVDLINTVTVHKGDLNLLEELMGEGETTKPISEEQKDLSFKDVIDKETTSESLISEKVMDENTKEFEKTKELVNLKEKMTDIDNSFYTIKLNGEKTKKEAALKDHKDAFEILVKELIDNKVIESCEDIKAVGHRTVQGGEKYDHTVVIDESVINDMIKYKPLAPLHNPASITGIEASKEVFPNALQTAVFDTAFHATMDKVNYIYPVPYEWYTEYGVRKYGMHGTSHRYVSKRMNEILDRDDTRIITCHIGNGGSISAIVDGKCIDTSMGLTPNAGIMMGSRCGDIDSSIIPYIMEQTGMSAKEMDTALNKKSGLLGVSGVSSDSRDIEDGINNGDERCKLAQKMYVNRIVNYIAMYYVEMGGADAIVFTAGVGENSISTRRQIVDKLGALGIKLDEEANNVRGEERKITTDDSKVPVYIIPTDEELMIARDTYSILLQG